MKIDLFSQQNGCLWAYFLRISRGGRKGLGLESKCFVVLGLVGELQLGRV